MATQARVPGSSLPSSMLVRALGGWRQLQANSLGQGSVALVDQAVVSGTRFLTTVVVGRTCGADALGIYSLAFIFVVVFICVQDALISTPYTVFSGRLCGRRLRLLAGSVLAHQAMLSVVAVCCLISLGAALSLRASLSPLASVLWILGGVMPFCLLREFARKFVFARLKVLIALGIDAVAAVVQIGGLIALACFGILSPATALAVMGFACAASGLGWLYLARTEFQPRRIHARKQLKQNWRFGKWLCATQLSGVVHANIVEFCLMAMVGAAATGRYVACLTLVLLCNPFILGVVNYMTPKAVQALCDDGDRGVRRVTMKTSFLFAGAIGTYCLLLAVFGDALLLIVFGKGFAGQGLIIVLALCSLAWGQIAAVSCGLAAIERADVSFRGGLIGLGLTAIAVPVLVPSWGSVGAAIGLLIGSITSAALQTFTFLRLTR